jgi:Fur family ferric uptake transcriptional regulator
MKMRIIRNSNLTQQDRLTTRQRRLILDTLHESEHHLNAKELYRRAAEKDPRISMATIYRNLRFFKELGLVDEQRLDEVQCYYELKTANEHYHLICQGCGGVTEFESPAVSKLLDDVQRNKDFVVTRAVLYLEGYCHKCKGGLVGKTHRTKGIQMVKNRL